MLRHLPLSWWNSAPNKQKVKFIPFQGEMDFSAKIDKFQILTSKQLLIFNGRIESLISDKFRSGGV